MSSINTASITDKKNTSLLKKTKNFFTKKKAKHSDNLNIDNSTSIISNKEESTKTLNTTPGNNGEDNISLKQNNIIITNSEIFPEDKSILSKSEIFSEKEFINRSMEDMDKKLNNMEIKYKEKLEELQSNQSEVYEKLNCLLWQINNFRKNQTELVDKVKEDIDDVKNTLSKESTNINNLDNSIEEIKLKMISDNNIKIKERNIENEFLGHKTELENIYTKVDKLQSEIKDVRDCIYKDIQEIKINSEKTKDKYDLVQISKFQDLNTKLNNLESKFEDINNKIEILNSKIEIATKEITPKKIDINTVDEKLIDYITKCVQEKMEKQYMLKELELKDQQNQNIINNINIKINELNDKLDEFQVYQLSREVEWQQMKIKINDSLSQIDKKERNLPVNNNTDDYIEKLNNENSKIKETQEKINNSLLELQTTINNIKENIYKSLNDQQLKINDIDKSIKLTQRKNVNDSQLSNKETVNLYNKEISNTSGITENADKLNVTIASLSDDIKILNMETKVMTTNISLLWDDIRTVKNFINQYDLNERLKESESNEEFTEIYKQINDLKKIINDQNK